MRVLGGNGRVTDPEPLHAGRSVAFLLTLAYADAMAGEGIADDVIQRVMWKAGRVADQVMREFREGGSKR